jgi:hypothetical protein
VAKIPTCHPDLKHEAKGMCRACYVKYRYATDENFKNKTKRRASAWANTHRAEYKKRLEKWCADNRSRSNEIKLNWRKNNITKAKEIERTYRKNNRNARNAGLVKYRCSKLQRTPSWANLNRITNIYKNCPKGKVVDHIVPLRGKNVSGLHVEYNLQYLTPEQNSRKCNKFSINQEINL